MRLKKLLIVSLTASAVVLSGTAAPASAAPPPRSFKNCTELNKVYPHGVGRKGAHDNAKRPVTNFRVDNTLYSYNDGGPVWHRGEHDLDRDNDGIACEKR